MAEEKSTRIFNMQPGANYYEAITIYSSGEGVINLGEALKGLGKKRAIENESENENANANLPSALHELVDRGAALVLPDFLERYRAFWKRVLADEDFIAAFKVQAPRGFEGNFNMKLFCNIIGVLKNPPKQTGKEGFFGNIGNRKLGNHFFDKNVESYIGNPYLDKKGNPTSDTQLTQLLTLKLQHFLEKT